MDRLKLCTKCGEEKPLTAFYKHSRMPDGLQYYCKDCTKKANKISYNKPTKVITTKLCILCDAIISKKSTKCVPCSQATQTRHKGVKNTCSLGHSKTASACKICNSIKSMKYHKDYRDRCMEYLGGPKCADCGIIDERVLEFDHLPGFQKINNIARMSSRPWSEVTTELDKCELVCANCHIIRTKDRAFKNSYAGRTQD